MCMDLEPNVMDAVVLCGGEGSRFAAGVEKPLFPIDGVPMVDRVVEALMGSHTGDIYAAVSPNTPETAEHLAARNVVVIETAGEGYVADLQSVLEEVGRPVLTVAADLPLLVGSLVDEALSVFVERREESKGDAVPSLSLCVPRSLKRALGVSADANVHGKPALSPTGLNVVGDGRDTYHRSWDARLAVNVNRRADATVAERLSGYVHVSAWLDTDAL